MNLTQFEVHSPKKQIVKRNNNNITNNHGVTPTLAYHVGDVYIMVRAKFQRYTTTLATAMAKDIAKVARNSPSAL